MTRKTKTCTEKENIKGVKSTHRITWKHIRDSQMFHGGNHCKCKTSVYIYIYAFRKPCISMWLHQGTGFQVEVAIDSWISASKVDIHDDFLHHVHITCQLISASLHHRQSLNFKWLWSVEWVGTIFSTKGFVRHLAAQFNTKRRRPARRDSELQAKSGMCDDSSNVQSSRQKNLYIYIYIYAVWHLCQLATWIMQWSETNLTCSTYGKLL